MDYLVAYHNHNDDYQYVIVEASSTEKAKEIAILYIADWMASEGWEFYTLVLLSEFEKLIKRITTSEDVLNEEYL